MNRLLLPEFEYSQGKNPYNDRLEAYQSFVLKDNQAEQFAGNWNKNIFGREAPLHLEIGVGMGHFMLEFLTKFPECNFVGLDYRFKRSFLVAKKLANTPSSFFRFLRARGERVPFMFAKEELSAIHCYFLDPWPKERHHRRRLFQLDFFENLCPLLKSGGKIYGKTDHIGLWEHLLELFQNPIINKLYKITLIDQKEWPLLPYFNIETHFEKIFKQQNLVLQGFFLEKK